MPIFMFCVYALSNIPRKCQWKYQVVLFGLFTFILYFILRITGTMVHKRILWLVHGLFVPWTVRTVDCSYPTGLFVPWTIRTITGRFVPCLYCWERRHTVYTVRVNPLRFSDIFFQKRLGIFSPNFTRLLYDYKFLFNCLQLWRSYAILSATTQRAFRPMMVDISSIWWWSRLIWHNFVKLKIIE